MPRFLLVAIALPLALAMPAKAKRPRAQLCPDAPYLVTGGSELVATGTPTVLVVASGHLTLEGACPPSSAVLKASKRGMKVTVRWNACGDVKKIVLAARATTDCSSITGGIRAKKHKRTTFAAAKSRFSPPWNQTYTLDPVLQARYGFAAEAGVAYGVSASRLDGSLLEGEVAAAVDGTPMDAAPFALAAAGLLIDPPGGGAVDIAVDALSHAPGDYRIRLDQLSAPTAAALAVGDAPNFDVLPDEASLRRYDLTGSANAPHVVTLQALFSGIVLAGEARVTSIDGTALGRAHLVKAADTRLTFVMPANGQAVLDVFARSLATDENGMQTYTAYLTEDQILSDTMTSVPSTQQAIIGSDDAIRRYRFTGTAGTLIRTRVQPVGNGFVTLARAGAVVAGARLGSLGFPKDQMTTLLDVDGEYTLDVACETGCTSADPFTVTLQAPQSLALDGVLHSAISQPQEVVSLVFDITIPGLFAMSIFDDDSGLNGTDADLFTPDGSGIGSIDDTAPILLGLSPGGRYTMDVKNGGGHTGGFTVGISQVQDPIAATFNGATAIRSGQIAVPGQLLYYTIDLTSGDHPRLAIDTPRANPITANSGLRAKARLLGPTNPPFGGDPIATATTGGSVGTETHDTNLGTVTAPSTGTYVVEITTSAAPGAGQLTGAFTWSVTKE